MKPLLPGDPEALGSYTITGRIGTGGMGVVYLGRSPSGRLAAVKLVRPEIADDPEFRARFRREIDTARQVSGAFTAPVLDADPDAERPWLATVYVEGPSLREKVFDSGPLPFSEVRALGAGLAEALADLHRVGLVHRDVKPGNVLLAPDGPRLIDFGIIRSDALADLTESGFVLGSAGFMAPEQAEGLHTGPEADVFALGAVVTFAAVGRGPFGTGSAATLLLRTVNEEPDLAGLPEGLRGVVRRCLARDPAARPTARELIGVLAPGADGLGERSVAAAGRAGAPTGSGSAASGGGASGSGAGRASGAPVGSGSAANGGGASGSGTGRAVAGAAASRSSQASSPLLPPPALPPARLAGSPGQLFQAPTHSPRSPQLPAYDPPSKNATRRDVLSSWGAVALFTVLGLGTAGIAMSGSDSRPSRKPRRVTPPSGGDITDQPSAPPIVTPTIVWSSGYGFDQAADPFGSTLALSPDGKVLYVGGTTLAAHDAATGATKWPSRTGPIGALLAEASAVYITTARTLQAITPDDGVPRWRVDSPDSGPNLDQTIAHVGSAVVCRYPTNADGPTVVAYDDLQQAKLWSATHSQHAAIAIAASAGLVLVADPAAHTLTAVGAVDGKQVWAQKLNNPSDVQASIVVTGSRVYVGGSALEAFELHAGTPLWRTLSDTITSHACLAADDQRLYAVDKGGTFFALDANDGTRAWAAGAGDFQLSAPSTAVVANGLVYVTDLETRSLTAIDVHSGALAWQWHESVDSPRPSRIGLVVSPAQVIAGFGSGLFCFPALG